MNKFSVITTVFNGEKTIGRTIESVVSQTYKKYEYIIVDAQSKDNTFNEINKYKKYISKIISEPDKSIYEGMNKGIQNSNGDIIAIINSGDTYSKNALKINQYFVKNNFDFMFGTVLKKKFYINTSQTKCGEF